MKCTNGKQFGCGHTPKFLLGRWPAKMLVGEPPQTPTLWDKMSQSHYPIFILCGWSDQGLLGAALITKTGRPQWTPAMSRKKPPHFHGWLSA